MPLININQEDKALLDSWKVHPREPYVEVIERILKKYQGLLHDGLRSLDGSAKSSVCIDLNVHPIKENTVDASKKTISEEGKDDN